MLLIIQRIATKLNVWFRLKNIKYCIPKVSMFTSYLASISNHCYYETVIFLVFCYINSCGKWMINKELIDDIGQQQSW